MLNSSSKVTQIFSILDFKHNINEGLNLRQTFSPKGEGVFFSLLCVLFFCFIFDRFPHFWFVRCSLRFFLSSMFNYLTGKYFVLK